MLTYDRFADERGLHPRDVDQLSRAELFWLPVIREAKEDAARRWRRHGRNEKRRSEEKGLAARL